MVTGAGVTEGDAAVLAGAHWTDGFVHRPSPDRAAPPASNEIRDFAVPKLGATVEEVTAKAR